MELDPFSKSVPHYDAPPGDAMSIDPLTEALEALRSILSPGSASDHEAAFVAGRRTLARLDALPAPFRGYASGDGDERYELTCWCYPDAEETT